MDASLLGKKILVYCLFMLNSHSEEGMSSTDTVKHTHLFLLRCYHRSQFLGAQSNFAVLAHRQGYGQILLFMIQQQIPSCSRAILNVPWCNRAELASFIFTIFCTKSFLGLCLFKAWHRNPEAGSPPGKEIVFQLLFYSRVLEKKLAHIACRSSWHWVGRETVKAAGDCTDSPVMLLPVQVEDDLKIWSSLEV